MVEIKAVTYEQARADFFKAEMQKAENRMLFWQTKIKKAKNAVAEMEAHDNASNAGWEYNFYNDALEALAAQPKWISVEEKLPVVGEVVLVRAKVKPHESVSHDALTFASYWNDECWVVDFLDDTDEIIVTHWMPTPELPKEEA